MNASEYDNLNPCVARQFSTTKEAWNACARPHALLVVVGRTTATATISAQFARECADRAAYAAAGGSRGDQAWELAGRAAAAAERAEEWLRAAIKAGRGQISAFRWVCTSDRERRKTQEWNAKATEANQMAAHEAANAASQAEYAASAATFAYSGTTSLADARAAAAAEERNWQCNRIRELFPNIIE